MGDIAVGNTAPVNVLMPEPIAMAGVEGIVVGVVIIIYLFALVDIQ